MKFERRKLVFILCIFPLVLVSELRSIVISFISALFLAACLQGPIQICRKFHIPRAVTAFFFLLLVIVPAVSLIGYGSYRLITATIDALEQLLPLLRGSTDWEEWLYRFITALPPGAQVWIHRAVNALFEQSDVILSGIVSKLGAWSAGWIAGLPTRIGNAGLFLLFFLFCAVGYDQVKEFLLSLLPADWSGCLSKLHRTTKQQLLNWFGAESKLIVMIFSELSLGLCILRTKSWLWIALCIALVDVVPFIGAGLILLPWAFIQFLTKNQIHALGLLLLWLIVWTTRTLLEPRLVGTQLQIPPAISFLSAVIGIQVWGMKGLILFPVLTAVLVTVLSHEKKGATQSSGAPEKKKHF